ncbi:pyridoxamine 5'-phosphate oxidase family protein [Telmatospirillum siberiense]|uniref:Flavin-nucleotide-binding protein n=1 Tax=Telmatospirillum siberiense TaxID=382514 RepID=A0A2N3PP92_9PROT|nr:pyridoxamine 5'-phosphate oxidase family protein [Telmatospirillum siberiense]PKU22196.1 flavin-nucleotide-binding protein [Telmatospirillum siberiense]
MTNASGRDDATFPQTPVNQVKRAPDRGRYDKKTIYEILDAALICHIAYVVDGRPYCTPTSFWREGDRLYWHGSSASRMIRAQGRGIDVCLTVTHLDALVMARSGFHHSVNYRSAMVFGQAHVIEEAEEKLRLMDRFIDRVYPGRSRVIRPPTVQEIKATTMIGMEIETASGKVRDKHVADDEADYEAVPAWSALYPVSQILGAPSECPRQRPGLARPDEMADFAPGARLDEVMAKAHRRTFR